MMKKGASNNTFVKPSFNYQQKPQAKTLQGHTKKITGLAVLPNGLLLSGDSAGDFNLWDHQTGQCIRTLRLEPSNSFAVLPDGNLAIHEHDRGVVSLWNLQTGQCIHSNLTHTQYVRYAINSTVILPNGILACLSNDFHDEYQKQVQTQPRMSIPITIYQQTIRLWNLQTEQCIHTLKLKLPFENYDYYSSLGVLRNGTLISYDAREGTINLFDTHTWQIIHTIGCQKDTRTHFAELPDGTLVTTQKNNISFWNPQTGQSTYTPIHSSNYCNPGPLAVLPDGILVSVGDPGVQLWDPQTGQCIDTLASCKSDRQFLAVLPDGTLAYAQDMDKNITFWTWPTKNLINTNNNPVNPLPLPATNLGTALKNVLNSGSFAVTSTQGGLSIAYQPMQSTLTPLQGLRALKNQLRNNNLIDNIDMLNGVLVITTKNPTDIVQLQTFLETEGVLPLSQSFKPGFL